MLRKLISSFSLLSVFCWVQAAAAAVQSEGPDPGMPRDVSVDGHRIDFLIDSVSIPIALLFVIMVIWMAIAMVQHRDGKHEAEYDHGVGRKNAMHALIISAVIFFGVDGWLFYWSMKDMGEAFWNFPTAEDTLKIEVNAQQWSWNFRYAGPDDKFNTPDDIVTINDMRVPTGRPVMLKLTAKDVIHSFYLPNLRVKTDAVPGNTTQTWFQAKETGQFDIACAQHCGTHHFKMRGQLTILEPDAYEAWAKEMSTISQLAHNPDDPDLNWGWNWEDS